MPSFNIIDKYNREVGRRFQREGIYVYLWLVHIVWQKPTQHCEAIIFQIIFLKVFKVMSIFLNICYEL